MVSFMPRLLYPQGQSLWYPLDRMLGGPQSCSGHSGEEKNFQPLTITILLGYPGSEKRGGHFIIMNKAKHFTRTNVYITSSTKYYVLLVLLALLSVA
jgi:hypothetical protein